MVFLADFFRIDRVLYRFFLQLKQLISALKTHDKKLTMRRYIVT